METDIFDEIASELTDSFDDTKSTEEEVIDKIKSDVSALLEKFDQKARKSADAKISAEIATLVKKEVAKIKPVQNVIEKTIEKTIVEKIPSEPVPVPEPQKIIERTEVQIKNVPNPLEKELKAAQDKIDELENKLADAIKRLTKDVNDAKQPVVISSGLFGSNDTYLVSNVTATRSFNATSTSLDELANVVGSLITTLKGAGVVK